MSKVLDELAASSDGLERDLGRALRAYQDTKASRGDPRGIGYEPRDIRRLGAAAVVESRVRKQSSGFDNVPAALSYEAIVLKYPDRFAEDVVAIARERMDQEAEVLKPSASPVELERRVHELSTRTTVAFSKGVIQPERVVVTTTVIMRLPGVIAYVLRRAKGRCEACNSPAPFKKANGDDYLEVHHVKPLAEGGSDRIENAVALCPNCHRAMHSAADAKERMERLYSQSGWLANTGIVSCFKNIFVLRNAGLKPPFVRAAFSRLI